MLHRPGTARVAPRTGRDEGVALIAVIATLIFIVPLALGAMVIVAAAAEGVVYERSRTVTAHVAEAGLDAATAALRSAPAGGAGIRSLLPCADATPLTGPVGAQAPGLLFSVRVRYYVVEPRRAVRDLASGERAGLHARRGWPRRRRSRCSSPRRPARRPPARTPP